jgi:major outer membrane protein
MKKLIITTFLLLSCGFAVYALPVGNPSEASLLTQGIFFGKSSCNTCDPCFYWFDAWSLRLGYYGDFVFNRNLEIDGNGLGQGRDIKQTQIFTNAGYLALNICDKIDIFGTLGASRLTITTAEDSWFILGNSEGRLDWETTFSWSAGARGTLYTGKHIAIGVEGQYFQTDPDLTSYMSVFDGRYDYFNENNEMRFQEWQVGTGISYQLDCCFSNLDIVPYAAVKWAWSRLRTNNFTFIKTATADRFTIFNMEAAKLWGYALGVSFVWCDNVCFTIEGRWADEKAFYLNGQFRF